MTDYIVIGKLLYFMFDKTQNRHTGDLNKPATFIFHKVGHPRFDVPSKMLHTELQLMAFGW
jgi:hypothetical protein